MALTLAILPGSANNVGSSGQMRTLTASVTNSGATSVTLQALTVSGDGTGVNVLGQPDFLTPNQPVGVGAPTIAAGATSFFPFRVEFLAPNFPGPSPQSPGGAAGVGNAAVPNDSAYLLNLTSLSSDGTAAAASFQVGVASTLFPFPIAQGGAMQLYSGFNLVNFITSFA